MILRRMSGVKVMGLKQKIENAMEKEYGTERGKRIYYASIVKGKIKGVEGKGGKGTLAKAKNTYKKEHSQ